MLYWELAKVGRDGAVESRKRWNRLSRPFIRARMGDGAMAFQAVPDTAEITVVCQQNLENITNTFHATLVGGYVLADIQLLAATVDAAVAVNWLPIQTLDLTYLRTEVRGLAVENDLFAQDGTGAGPGGDAVEGLPNNVTLSVKKNSGLTGRSARGRLYFMGLPSNDLSTNENQWAATTITAVEAAIEAVRVAITATAWSPTIVSRFTGGLPRAVGFTFNWTGSVAVNANVDSQRGRLTV